MASYVAGRGRLLGVLLVAPFMAQADATIANVSVAAAPSFAGQLEQFLISAG